MGTDTVPAMLTPGEFIMSRGAVNMFGADTMMAMNKAWVAEPTVQSMD